MLVNKKTVLNENRACVHVQWTEKSGSQIWFNWLIEFDGSPQSCPEVSKEVCLFNTTQNVFDHYAQTLWRRKLKLGDF